MTRSARDWSRKQPKGGMPQTGRFVLRDDRRRAVRRTLRMVAWTVAGLIGYLVAIWIVEDVEVPLPLSLVIVVVLVAAIVLSQLLSLISRPLVVAHDKGIWVQLESLWHPPSPRFLPWEKVQSVGLVSKTEWRRNTPGSVTTYFLRIVPHDVAAEYAAHPAYEAKMSRAISRYGAPYVVVLGNDDGLRWTDHKWDQVLPKLKELMPPRVRAEEIAIRRD